MQDNFLTKISHEVRTPINAILGLGYLFQQTRLEDQQRKYLTTIMDSAQNLLNTFQSILDYTSTEEDALEIQNLPFVTSILLENVARFAKPKCQERGLQFEMNVAANVPQMLIGDSLRISQILQNITDNAIKFTPQGKITVSVSIQETANVDHDDIIFSIVDTGIGIPEDKIEDIFKPFMQVDNSHSRNYEGAGLGLATCYQLVKRMQGNIEVYANPQAESGSVFRVILPLPEAEFQDTEQAIQDSPLKGKSVLMVDHLPLRSQVMSTALITLGMSCEAYTNGEELLTKLAASDASNTSYDFIILAWQTPDMDGLETAEYIKQLPLQCERPSLLLFSDYDPAEVEDLAYSVGFSSVLHTPAPISTLQETLVDMLDKKAAEQAQNIEEVEEDDGPIRILLVEDNEINQEIASEVLKTAQYEVDIANNGQEAVDMVEQNKYHLVLMDVQMPIMDGLEATKCIRANGHKLPIIAMTAHAMHDDKETSISAGMNAHLTKPLEPMALFSTLNSWLPARSSAKKEAPKVVAAPTRKAKLPDKMEGFNLNSGLATVGGNEALYISLLRKFADRYATINNDISDCLQQDDLDTAVRHAHTIRGIAANLGAETLSEAAEALEKTIKHSPTMITPHLCTLVMRLGEAVDAINSNLGSSLDSEEVGELVPISECINEAEKEHARHVLHTAMLNIEKDWGHAVDTVKYLYERLDKTATAKDLRMLTQALEDFETEEAQKISLRVQKVLLDS